MLTLFTKKSNISLFNIQYDGYCYYIETNYLFGSSFIVTKETNEYIMGDLIVSIVECSIYQLVYNKHHNTWSRYYHGEVYVNSTIENELYNKITGVLYVMQYRRMMTNLYYLFHHIDLLPDIYTYMNKLMLDTFPKDTFTIL